MLRVLLENVSEVLHGKRLNSEKCLMKDADGKSMCMGKVVVRCPKCARQLQVTRPDSYHSFWSIDKPKEDEGITNVIVQDLECKKTECSTKFSIYWYDK